MSTMRAVLTDPDHQGAVALREREAPEPGPGERLVHVRAFSLNRGELKFAKGKAAGSTIGWDVAGVLDDGTRVVGFSAPSAGWAERVALKDSAFTELPDHVSFEAACALPVAAGTALACVDAGGPLLGRRVLVTGVTGGVGGFAVRLAKLAGAQVTAQVREDSQVAYATGLGADEVVVTSDGAELDGRGPFRLFVDGIGGALLTRGLTVLDTDGVGVSYGMTGSSEVSLPVGVLLGKGRAKLRGLNLYAVSDKEPPREWLARLVALVADGRLAVDHEVRGGWEGVSQAAEDLLERRFRGKAVLTVG